VLVVGGACHALGQFKSKELVEERDVDIISWSMYAQYQACGRSKEGAAPGYSLHQAK
jgi:hypothetical protein